MENEKIEYNGIEFDTMQEMTEYRVKKDPIIGCLIGCIVTLLVLIAIGVL